MTKYKERLPLIAAVIAALAMAVFLIGIFSLQGTLGLAQWYPPWRLNFILLGASGLLPLAAALPHGRARGRGARIVFGAAALSLSCASLALTAKVSADVLLPANAHKWPVPALNLIDPARGIEAPANGILRLSLSSDPHWGARDSDPAARTELLRSVASAWPRRDAFFILGDNVDTGMIEASWHEEAQELAAILGNMPIRSILGNHDALIGGEYQFERYFLPPALKTDSGSPFYYSMDAGAATIVVLDLLWGAESFGRDQAEWLEKRLSAVPAGRQVIVLSHSYIYSSGTFDEYGEPYYDKPSDIAKVAPILERHKVALVVSGHNHHMELLRKNGVTYAIIGVMGGVFDPERSYRSPASLWYRSGIRGRIDLDISARGLALAFVDLKGERLREEFIPAPVSN